MFFLDVKKRVFFTQQLRKFLLSIVIHLLNMTKLGEELETLGTLLRNDRLGFLPQLFLVCVFQHQSMPISIQSGIVNCSPNFGGVGLWLAFLGGKSRWVEPNEGRCQRVEWERVQMNVQRICGWICRIISKKSRFYMNLDYFLNKPFYFAYFDIFR